MRMCPIEKSFNCFQKGSQIRKMSAHFTKARAMSTCVHVHARWAPIALLLAALCVLLQQPRRPRAVEPLQRLLELGGARTRGGVVVQHEVVQRDVAVVDVLGDDPRLRRPLLQPAEGIAQRRRLRLGRAEHEQVDDGLVEELVVLDDLWWRRRWLR